MYHQQMSREDLYLRLRTILTSRQFGYSQELKKGDEGFESLLTAGVIADSAGRRIRGVEGRSEEERLALLGKELERGRPLYIYRKGNPIPYEVRYNWMLGRVEVSDQPIDRMPIRNVEKPGFLKRLADWGLRRFFGRRLESCDRWDRANDWRKALHNTKQSRRIRRRLRNDSVLNQNHRTANYSSRETYENFQLALRRELGYEDHLSRTGDRGLQELLEQGKILDASGQPIHSPSESRADLKETISEYLYRRQEPVYVFRPGEKYPREVYLDENGMMQVSSVPIDRMTTIARKPTWFERFRDRFGWRNPAAFAYARKDSRERLKMTLFPPAEEDTAHQPEAQDPPAPPKQKTDVQSDPKTNQIQTLRQQLADLQKQQESIRRQLEDLSKPADAPAQEGQPVQAKKDSQPIAPDTGAIHSQGPTLDSMKGLGEANGLSEKPTETSHTLAEGRDALKQQELDEGKSQGRISGEKERDQLFVVPGEKQYDLQADQIEAQQKLEQQQLEASQLEKKLTEENVQQNLETQEKLSVQQEADRKEPEVDALLSKLKSWNQDSDLPDHLEDNIRGMYQDAQLAKGHLREMCDSGENFKGGEDVRKLVSYNSLRESIVNETFTKEDMDFYSDPEAPEKAYQKTTFSNHVNFFADYSHSPAQYEKHILEPVGLHQVTQKHDARIRSLTEKGIADLQTAPSEYLDLALSPAQRARQKQFAPRKNALEPLSKTPVKKSPVLHKKQSSGQIGAI